MRRIRRGAKLATTSLDISSSALRGVADSAGQRRLQRRAALGTTLQRAKQAALLLFRWLGAMAAR